MLQSMLARSTANMLQSMFGHPSRDISSFDPNMPQGMFVDRRLKSEGTKLSGETEVNLDWGWFQ
jgi:hypothetical protein